MLNLLRKRHLAGAIYLISACFLSTAILAEPYDPQLGPKIDTYLLGRNSPIAGNGAVFFSDGMRDDVDPRLVVAIAGAESSFGTQWVNCPQSGFNAWSLFFNRTCPRSSFDSFAAGIDRVTRQMAIYFNRNWNTIPIIGSHYCPAGCGSWVGNVTNFYTEQQGDTEDLTFHIGLIDFEQFTGAPRDFTGAQPPLQVFAAINGTVSTKIADSATISGGQLLNLATDGPPDPSIVYGTVDTVCSGCLPAITIQFAHKVSNFSVFLLDGSAPMIVMYIVEDDQGGMQTKTNMPIFGAEGWTVTLPDTGIRQVTVTSNGGGWDFFIDNIRFSPD